MTKPVDLVQELKTHADSAYRNAGLPSGGEYLRLFHSKADALAAALEAAQRENEELSDALAACQKARAELADALAEATGRKLT